MRHGIESVGIKGDLADLSYDKASVNRVILFNQSINRLISYGRVQALMTFLLSRLLRYICVLLAFTLLVLVSTCFYSIWYQYYHLLLDMDISGLLHVVCEEMDLSIGR